MRKQIAFCILSFIGLILFTPAVPAAYSQIVQIPPAPQAPQAPPQLASPAQKDSPLYIIQPNDELEIYVWKQPEMSKTVTVLPDGRISIPTVQDMKAAGLNPGQLKLKIEEALKGVLEVPDVTVMVKSIRSYTVYVGGKVGKQGGIMMEKPVNVLTAILLAGGFADYANTSEIVVLRGNGEDSRIIRVDFKEIIKGTNQFANILLRAGDVVYVQ